MRSKVYIISKNGDKKRFWGIIPGLTIHFKGKGSEVCLHEPIPRFSKCKIKIGSNSKVIIGKYSNCHWKIRNTNINAVGNNQKIIIGDNFKVNGCDINLGNEDNLSVYIGDDCMFSNGIVILPSDQHSIINSLTNEVINEGKNIIIGNHVWLTGGVEILKGVNIADNCIIGRHSLVTKNLNESYCLYAGIPVKKIREHVDWSELSPSKYSMDMR